MPDEPQPTLESITQKAAQLRSVWAKAHAVWDETDTWVQGTYQVWPNEADRATRGSTKSHTARTIIDRTSDNMLPFSPRWSREEVREPSEKTNADPVENFVDAVWQRASQEEMSLPTKVLGRNILKYNYGVLEARFTPQDEPIKPKVGDADYDIRLREYEERQWDFCPFGVSAPHPKTVLLPPYERRPSYAIKCVYWTRAELVDYLQSVQDADAENLVEVTVPELGADPYAKLLVLEEFNKRWHGLVVEGEGLLLVEKNLTGLVPFCHVWAGFGDVPGTSDGDDPRYLAQGFLFPARELLRLLDQIISAKAELEMKAAYAPLVGPEELLEKIAALLQQGSNMIPGTIRDLGFLPVQNLPQYLADFQDRVERAIVAATVSTVTFGERPVGVDTVGVHAMMLQVSMKRFIEAMEQISFLCSEIGSMWLQMLAAWKGRVTVSGHGLSGSELKGRNHIQASFPMTDEAVKQQRTQVGAALVDGRKKSLKRHLEEDQGVTDVTGEMEEILRDEVRADPILHSAFAEKTREAMGLQEMYEEQVERLKQERMGAFNQVQAERGQPGVKVPASEEQMVVRGAEKASFVRPPAAGPGTGQPTNGRGT